MAGKRKFLRRVQVGTVGLSIVALGIVLMPLPGPGTIIVLGGLLHLRREFAWAERMLSRLRRRVGFLGRWIKIRDSGADSGT